jgi:hypothetical protein
MKESINEHDMTKKMMSIMRGGFKTLLKEEELPAEPTNQAEPTQAEPQRDSNDVDDDKDTITLTNGDPVFNEELKKLQSIDTNVVITKFKIYPQDNNVVIEGTFLRGKDVNSGINFIMDLRAGEIQIPQANIELNDNVSEVLKKLKGQYANFCQEWNEKLPKEYNSNTSYDNSTQNV